MTIPPRTSQTYKEDAARTIAIAMKMNPKPWLDELLTEHLVDAVKRRDRIVLPEFLPRWKKLALRLLRIA